MTRITLGVGESKTVTLSGGRFYYESGEGKILVKTNGNDSVSFELSPGMGFQNRPDQMNFPSVEIYNLHNVEQDIDFFVSYREVFDNRVNFGSLEFVKSTLLVPNSYSRFLASPAANATLYGAVGLRVVGSEKDLYIPSIHLATPGDYFISMITDYSGFESSSSVTSMINAIARGAIFPGDDHPTLNVPESGGFSCNLDFGGEPSSYGYALRRFRMAVQSSGETRFENPLKLSAGSDAAVIVHSTAVNLQFFCSFETFELDP